MPKDFGRYESLSNSRSLCCPNLAQTDLSSPSERRQANNTYWWRSDQESQCRDLVRRPLNPLEEAESSIITGSKVSPKGLNT